MNRCSALMLIVCASLLPGCGQRSVDGDRGGSLARQIGHRCRIQFRRDALGIAGSHAVAPDSDEKQGASVEIRGTLTALDGEYLIVRQDQAVTWVPQSVILLVRFDEAD
jgi:hypothetical protein